RMETRSPYAVLGIPVQASASDVRAAYRAMALRLHPDVAGSESGRAFREVRDAYELLRDPIARRNYDWSHGATEESYSEARHRRRFAEPMRLRRAPWAAVRRRLDAAALDPTDLSASGFVHEGPLGVRETALRFDLVLSREEARYGGRFEFTVPIRHRCDACG